MQKNRNDILFDKFEIIECFKKDEHTGVYLANHIYLNQKIILKVLNTATIPEPIIIDRFKREAKLLARLNHPNIIKVLDFGTHEDYFYISFEYFKSNSLRALLKKNKLNESQKTMLVVQALKAFAYAHKNGIIHRDIKPENIFVNDNYELKIGDFGLAFEMNENFVTGKYTIVGTPCYMSPEQIQGKRITQQSDIFSLGIVAYELFTGSNPFLGKDINETINNIISYDEKNLLNGLSPLSEQIQELIKGMLRKNIKSRIKSANEALILLDIHQEKIITKNITRRLWFSAAFLILLLAISITIIILMISSGNNLTEIEPTIIEKTRDTTDYAERKEDINQKESNFKYQNDKGMNESEANSGVANTSQTPIIEPAVIKTGELYVECFPWAEVTIDSIKIDTTPLRNNIKLTAGSHNIILSHPDYPIYRGKIEITAGMLTSIKVNLDTLFGYVNFNVFPWGEIYLNNKLIGQTPFSESIKLNPGSYDLVLKNPHAEQKEMNIIINQNDTLLITHRFNTE